MDFIFEKNMRIISDILAYCHNRGARHCQVDIEWKESLSVCEIRAALDRCSEEQLSELRALLGTPRQHEIEQSFWGLSGDVDIDPELALIGMMIDRVDVTFAGGWLTIRVEREEE